MKKILFLFVLSAYCLTAPAQTDDHKYRKEFEEFVNYSLAVDILQYMQDEFDDYLEKQSEDVAARIREVYPLIERQYHDFIFNEMMAVHRRHIDYKQLRSINKFYRTKAGRTMRMAQYPIMKEMMLEVHKLTENIGTILAECFKEEVGEE